MANLTKNPRYIAVELPLTDGNVTVYAAPRLAELFREISMDMDIYKGVKLAQILESVYEQGKKDGARAMVDAVNDKFEEAKLSIPHKNPGRPRKK